ncbi:hypothetical protein F2P79_024179 [Pimephales promelas]|nr:hypothetical protein F2P79_024179 [Pimephales promelas]
MSLFITQSDTTGDLRHYSVPGSCASREDLQPQEPLAPGRGGGLRQSQRFTAELQRGQESITAWLKSLSSTHENCDAEGGGGFVPDDLTRGSSDGWRFDPGFQE